MGTRKRLTVPALAGFLLIIAGFFALVGSYFLLPLYVSTYCGDSCIPLQHPTVWELTLYVRSIWGVASAVDLFVLALLYLSLLAAVVVVASSLGFFAYPDRAFEIWIRLSLLLGSIALALPLLLVALYYYLVRLDNGCYGMLAGYALFWAGHRVFLIAHPEARY